MSTDRYIRLATAGMPRPRRLERAAELRHDIGELTRRFQREGFSRQEAEHLALEEMGPARAINDRYWFGIVNTLGWTLFWPLSIGSAAFAVWWFLLSVPTGVTPVQPEQQTASRSYRLTLPAGTEFLQVALVHRDGQSRLTLYPTSFASPGAERPTFRDRLVIAGSRSHGAGLQEGCARGNALLTFEAGGATDRLCLAFPVEVDHLSWADAARGSPGLAGGRWVPVGAFSAEHAVPVRAGRDLHGSEYLLPFEWVGILVYLDAEEPPLDPPTMAELSRHFPGLRTLEPLPQ